MLWRWKREKKYELGPRMSVVKHIVMKASICDTAAEAKEMEEKIDEKTCSVRMRKGKRRERRKNKKS